MKNRRPRAGGGIVSTVTATRAASEDALFASATARLEPPAAGLEMISAPYMVSSWRRSRADCIGCRARSGSSAPWA